MTEKRLTEEEAEQFLELFEKLNADMNEAFDDAGVFGGKSNTDEFEEKWGMNPSTAYMASMRGRYKQFVEKAYIDTEEETASN